MAQIVKTLPALPGSGRFLGEDKGSPLHCSCLEHPRDRGAWWAGAWVAESLTRLSAQRFDVTVYEVPRSIRRPALLVLVMLKALHVWFYASLTNTSWVDTVISFLQVKKLRHRGGITGVNFTFPGSISCIVMELKLDV